MEAEENSDLSEESLASLTAGDVLIRSTSFHMKQTPLPCRTSEGADGKPAACVQERIRISVKKLREVSPPCHPEDSTLTDDYYIPPALPANKPESQKPTAAVSRSTAAGAACMHSGRNLELLPSGEKEVSSQKALPTTGNGNKQKATDIFISQYETGQKEAVRAVFKQRIQNVPVSKEVKVQLLDNRHPNRKDTHGEVNSATTIAAATAAAIASTAPLLKVQSDLEAKVNSVSEMLSKLQETDKQLQRVTERQASLKAQQPERLPCHQRVCELEKHMTLFMQKQMRHLETLQQQQMNIQSHLINSALNPVGFQAVHVPPPKRAVAPAVNTGRPFSSPTSPHQRDLFPTNPWNVQASSRPLGNRAGRKQKSPLKTPTPRRYAPVPVSKDAKISHKVAKREQPMGEKENVLKAPYKEAQGGGKFLEQILNAQGSPFSQSGSPWKEPPANRKMAWELERERLGAPQAEPFPALKNPVQDFNLVERTTKRADDVLRDLGQLRREMQDILQEAKEWKSDMNGLMKQKDQILLRPPEAQTLPKPLILQTDGAPKSMLKDAERILRLVRKNKKVLEENLEAIVRAKDGDALNSFIDTLTANRDVLEEIRIRKTVDEWIKAISLEIQDEMARKAWEEDRLDDERRKRLGLKAKQTVRPTKTGREEKSESQYPQGRTVRRPLPAARAAQKPARNPVRGGTRKVRQVLRKCHGHHVRSPLKCFRAAVDQKRRVSLSRSRGGSCTREPQDGCSKSPYLRINSPPPKLKPPRPKLIPKALSGTKIKSSRTQTAPCERAGATSPKKSRPRSAPCREPQYLFSPIREALDVAGPLEGHLIPMAVPLGQKQINSIFPEPAGIIIGKFHPVTVTASVPPAPAKQQPSVQKPNIAVIEMRSEKKDPPQLSVQVLPSVDIDSVSSDSPSGNQAPSGLFPTQAAMQSTPEDSWHHGEDSKLPGTDLGDFVDLTQDEADGGEDDDGSPEFMGPVLEFNRREETRSPQYSGLPFPPVAPPQPSADILEEIIEKRETLENKLIGWVEQEVMARVIGGMFPAQKEAVPNLSSSESEESRAVSSDIVEAAGPGGFQLFVSAGVPVNSDMIRQFVSDALAETVAVMLGDRDSQKPASAAGASLSVALLPAKDLVLATPLGTPEVTPPPTPPPLREPSPVRTPEPSPPTTEIDSKVGGRQPVAAAEPEAASISPVHTPVATPVATPPGVVTPSPPLSERIPNREVTGIRQLPNAWGDAELPLEEEKPSPLSEEGGYRPRAVIMSVAKDEEPENLVLLPFPEPVRPPEPLLQEPPIPSSPGRSLSSGSSPEESSLSVTETETADRPISEGEVLFSYGQMVAMRGLAEEGLSLPNLSDSMASTLHDAHEMDYDPPSEGQVLLRPHKGYHRDPVLSLLSKHQAPLASQEDVCHSEDTDHSAGELSEGQRPRLSRAAESILMGRSVYMNRPSEPPLRQAPSLGRFNRAAGEALGDTDATRGPMSVAELEHPTPSTAEPDSRLEAQLDEVSQQSQHAPLNVAPAQPRVIQVRARSEMAQRADFQSDADRTHVEPDSYLLAEKGNVPQLSSLPALAKMSVTVKAASAGLEHSL
ncbi:protein TALPID3 [Sphaerodactylus townsendi]|uniref:protein TALPID3 n=1 Tax=Sphaerodactylus townsendi TaxID=933632 RepID=UPI0020274727|nr:protein TALPID3 [Sphaerodactylus townsendi]